MQSISKALVYGLALEDRGDAAVLEKIGVEPSGDAFSAISLKPVSGTPFNPMINAGAIATCGQVQKRIGRSRIQRIQAYLSGCAGRELALMAATLANQGVNPLTRHQAIAPDGIDNLLSVMSTCGMYDFSGEWIYRVGLPAKSGVAGGIMAVLPGQLGIGIFSPLLDAQGSPVRQHASHQCGGVGVEGLKLGALSLSTSAPAATASAFVVLKMAITMTIASTETTTEAQATRRQVLITGRACARRPEPTAPDEAFIIIPHLRMQVCPLQAAFQEMFRPVTSNLDPPCHAASWRV